MLTVPYDEIVFSRSKIIAVPVCVPVRTQARRVSQKNTDPEQ